jgi:hypothetical protein
MASIPPFAEIPPPSFLVNILCDTVSTPPFAEMPPPGLLAIVTLVSDSVGIPLAAGMTQPMPLELFGASLIERS